MFLYGKKGRYFFIGGKEDPSLREERKILPRRTKGRCFLAGRRKMFPYGRKGRSFLGAQKEDISSREQGRCFPENNRRWRYLRTSRHTIFQAGGRWRTKATMCLLPPDSSIARTSKVWSRITVSTCELIPFTRRDQRRRSVTCHFEFSSGR